MMLSTQLKLLKEKRKLTNQQLSDLSGVPVGTINRILSGQTDNPSFQTVCDMVMAMDGSLDELVGIQQEIPQAEKKARASQEILSLYEAMIESKNKWLHRLFVCCCVLTLVLIFLVIFDLMNPSVGFFRGIAPLPYFSRIRSSLPCTGSASRYRSRAVLPPWSKSMGRPAAQAAAISSHWREWDQSSTEAVFITAP